MFEALFAANKQFGRDRAQNAVSQAGGQATRGGSAPWRRVVFALKLTLTTQNYRRPLSSGPGVRRSSFGHERRRLGQKDGECLPADGTCSCLRECDVVHLFGASSHLASFALAEHQLLFTHTIHFHLICTDFPNQDCVFQSDRKAHTPPAGSTSSSSLFL